MLNDTLKSLPTISEELVETLDWAWLIDFGQGDFSEAKVKTEIALLGKWSNYNLVAKALVHQLRGEYKQALLLLEEALKSCSDPEEQLLIETIAYWTRRKAQENLADGFAIDKKPSQIDTEWLEKTKTIKEQVKNISCRLETNLIQQIATILPCWRTTIALQTDSKIRKQYQDLILEQLTEQLALYQGKEYYAISEFLYCCFAELLALSGQFVAGWELLENLAPAYFNSAKYLETARYLIAQGDLIVETYPFGKPVVFGYRLIDVNSDTATLLDRSQIDATSAQQLYLEARECFENATAERGVAIANMRLAYVSALQQQWYLAACGYEEAEQVFQKLGDNINGISARMGYFWSLSHYEALDSDKLARIEETAAWMNENGTSSFAMSWLLAFVLAAWEQFPAEEGTIVAQRLLQIAEIVALQGIDLEDSTSADCQKLWCKCQRAIGNCYRQLVQQQLTTKDEEYLFLTAEKAKIYSFFAFSKSLKVEHLRNELANVISFEEIAVLLPKDTLLLAYFTTDNYLLSWAVSEDGLWKTNRMEIASLLPEEDKNLKDQIELWLNNVRESDSDPKFERIVQQAFFSPFAAKIEASNHLAIALCDRLLGISFAALKYQYSLPAKILKKEAILGAEKTISYLSDAGEIAYCNWQKSLASNISIVAEAKNNRNSSLKLISDSFALSLSLAISTVKLYKASLFSTIEEMAAEGVGSRAVLNLFVAESESLGARLASQPIAQDLVILNLRGCRIRQLPHPTINSYSQTLLDMGAKTVVVFLESEDSLATTILTSFFYQGLYFGQSVAKALQQAQKQLGLLTAQETLDFCHYLQSHISWYSESDRALRALIAKYTGDVMAIGKNYQRAVEAYRIAIAILKDVGYDRKAKSLQNKYKMFQTLSKVSQPLEADLLVFDTPAHWNSVYIYGSWQLSFRDLA